MSADFCDLYVETADRQDRGTELDPELEIDDVWLARPANRRKISKITLKLNDATNSRLSLLLQRNCSGERGEIHVFRTPEGKPRHVRFVCSGKGRSRRYHFKEVS